MYCKIHSSFLFINSFQVLQSKLLHLIECLLICINIYDQVGLSTSHCPEWVKKWKVPLSADSYSPFGKDNKEVHNSEIDEATESLHSEGLSQFVECLKGHGTSLSKRHVDIVSLLHRLGINVRKLARILELCQGEEEALQALLLSEMISRVLRKLLNQKLRMEISPEDSAYVTAVIRFCRIVFGTGEESNEWWKTTLLSELSKRFPSEIWKGSNDLRERISMSWLFILLQEKCSLIFSSQANDRIASVWSQSISTRFSHGILEEEDLLSIRKRVKTMNYWLDLEEVQYSKEAEQVVIQERKILWDEISLGDLLLDGLTGQVFKGIWRDQEVVLTEYHEKEHFRQFKSSVLRLR